MSLSSKSVIFLVGNEEYGIPVEYVISIDKYEEVTPIPHLPSFVKGIVKSRGELIPVIDFELVLYQKALEVNDDVRMIVLHTDELSVGLLVKEAKEILDIANESLQQVGLLAYSKTAYFTSIANLEERLITMIDPNILIASLEGIKEIKEYMKENTQEVQ